MEYFYLIFKVFLIYCILNLILKIIDKNSLYQLNTLDIIFLLIFSYLIFNILSNKLSIFYFLFFIIIYYICTVIHNKIFVKNRKSIYFIKFKNKIDALLNKKEKINNETTNISFPLALILDGDIDYDSLNLLNKDKKWLESNLDCDVEEIYYAFYNNNNNKLYIIKKRDFNNL